MFGAGTVQWAWGLDNGGPTSATDTAHAAGHGQPVRRHGRAAGHADGRARRRPRRRPTPPRRPRRSRRRPQGANLSNGSAVTISGTATDAAAAWSPASRSRPTAARPGTRPPCPTRTRQSPGPTRGSPTGTRRRRSSPGRSTTAATSRRRPPASRSTSAAPARSGAPAVAPEDASTPATRQRSRSASSSPSDAFGFVTGIRFYKASTNTGTHVGNLWSATGQLLASATFTERDRLRLAAGHLRQPGRAQHEHDLRRVLLRAEGPLLGRQRVLLPDPARSGRTPRSPAWTARRCTRCADNGDVGNGRLPHSGHAARSRPAPTTRELLGRRRLHPQPSPRRPARSTNVTATAGYASATVSLVGSDDGRPGDGLHGHAVHRVDRADPDDRPRQPGADHGHHLRADQRHDLHVHGHRLEPGRHRPGVGARPTR